jgi:hypothetical protein
MGSRFTTKSREAFMVFSSRLRVCTGPTRTSKKTVDLFWVQPLESKGVAMVVGDDKL